MRRLWRLLLVWRSKMGKFDVFLCHNSQDKPAVIEIANQLKANYF
jgi:hypothetical protein